MNRRGFIRSLAAGALVPVVPAIADAIPALPMVTVACQGLRPAATDWFINAGNEIARYEAAEHIGAHVQAMACGVDRLNRAFRVFITATDAATPEIERLATMTREFCSALQEDIPKFTSARHCVEWLEGRECEPAISSDG